VSTLFLSSLYIMLEFEDIGPNPGRSFEELWYASPDLSKSDGRSRRPHVKLQEEAIDMRASRSLLVGVLLLVVLFSPTIAESGAYKPTAELMEVPVIEVIDGDTIRVKLGWLEEEVRYIGVDTPEDSKELVECYGPEATEKNEELLDQGRVWIERGVEERDNHGRLLGYVYLDPEGNSMVNKELLSQGYAILMTITPNYKYRQEFKELAKEAWQQGKGLWSACRVEQILSPDEVESNVEQYLGKIVQVQYEVARIGTYKGMVFLNAREDYKGHFVAVIYPDDLAADFCKSGLDISQLKGEEIRVEGKLELYEAADYEQPEIVVEAPWQVELVDG